jgi:hypothetical protein
LSLRSFQQFGVCLLLNLIWNICKSITTFAKVKTHIIENNMLHIDKNIPIPDSSGRGRKTEYILPELEVGDSFFVKGETSKYLAKLFYQKKKRNYELTARTMEGGVRIWRAA